MRNIKPMKISIKTHFQSTLEILTLTHESSHIIKTQYALTFISKTTFKVNRISDALRNVISMTK